MSEHPKVGYKRPPRDKCWKKGQSGNPSGRPRGHRNLAAVLTEILNETTTFAVNGRKRPMTKLEALTRQLVDKAAAGDSRIINPLLAEIHKNEAKTERTQAATTLSPVDHEVIRVLYARLARNALAMKKKE